MPLNVILILISLCRHLPRGHQLSKPSYWDLHRHGEWREVCENIPMWDTSSVCELLPLWFLLQGRFTIAAKHHISIAEIYETELVDIDKVWPSVCVSCSSRVAASLTSHFLLSVALNCELSPVIPGHRSLWTGRRLLQRRRIHQVIIFNPGSSSVVFRMCLSLWHLCFISLYFAVLSYLC